MISAVDDLNYIGWIESRNGVASYTISSLCTNSSIPDITTLRLDPELHYLLKDVIGTMSFIERLSSASTFDQLARLLQKFVMDEIGKGAIYIPFEDTLLPQLIMNQLQEVGWEKVVSINETFSLVSFQYLDSGQRNHEYDIYIGHGYPHVAPTVNAHLPCPVHFNWQQSSAPSIKTVVTAVEETIGQLQPLFEVQ